MPGLADFILATLANILFPSAIIILLLRVITIANVFLSISATVVLAGNPRVLGSKYSVIFYTTKNKSKQGNGLFKHIPLPVDGKICQVGKKMRPLTLFYCRCNSKIIITPVAFDFRESCIFQPFSMVFKSYGIIFMHMFFEPILWIFTV